MEVESLVQDLAAIGIVVDDVYELVNSSARYDAAVPVLAKWLPRATGFNEQEGIARALSVPWANYAVPALIDQFKRAQFVDPVLAWVCANAIGVAWAPEHLDEVLEIATAREYGKSRDMVVFGLSKRRNPKIADVLLNLLDDEDVLDSVLRCLIKRPDKRAREILERLVGGHENLEVRELAARALAKLK